jgi:histidinol-phosphate aminotransferase
MLKAPDYVLGVKPYVPGKPIEELERELGIRGSVKLASNENPLGPSKLAVDAIAGSLGSLNRYPDGSGYYLTRRLSGAFGIPQDCFILGNGSNELLDIAVRTFMRPGDEAVMATPSFVVYAMSARIQGGTPVEVPLTPDFRHDLSRMAEAVTDRTRMVFIANPNNPTGTINTREELDAFMEKIPEGLLVVLDEAYYEYVARSDYAQSMKHFASGRNILTLRTFSKIYGLAGLRIGYGIGRPDILEQMNRVRPPFNTGSLSQAAALAALDDRGHVERSVKINDEGKKFLYSEFGKLGLDFVPTEANFIYIPVDDAIALYERLLREGVIIRPMGKSAVRITIGLPHENERLAGALNKIMGNKSGHPEG